MASQTKITITHDKESTADLKMKLITQVASESAHASVLEGVLASLAGGSSNGTIALVVDDNDAAAATGTVEFSDKATADDTFLINGVAFTAKASGATGNQFNVGVSATASATNLKAAINASTSALVKDHVTATSAAGVVTITAKIVGLAGNAVTIAKGVDAGSVMTVSGARLTGGAVAGNSSSSSYSYGV